MADREFVAAHNSIVNLDIEAPGAAQVADILTFLSRSRISYAITESPSLSLDVLRDFWTDIIYDDSTNPPVIRTTVGKRSIEFSAFQLRRTLRLGTAADDSGPFEFSEDFIAGALSRMGYSGSGRGRYFTKTCVFGQWRFLWHVMATVFAPRKSGYDELSPALLSALLSLVYNKPMSFTQQLFASFVGQVTGAVKSRFLLYPRFTMLLIRDLLPDFPEVQPTIFVNMLGLRAFNVCFMYKDKRSDEPRPIEQKLFGAVVDPAYEAPLNNDWQEVESTAIVATYATTQAPAIADPEVKRLEGMQEQDSVLSEDSSKGLNLLMHVALKGKRKVSDMEDGKPLLRSGRRTRSASRYLMIDDVAQDNHEVETEPTVEIESPQEVSQVPITSQAEPTVASVGLDSHSPTEPFQSHATPTTASTNTTPGIDDTRFSKLESRVRKLKKLSKKLSSQLAFISDSAVEQNKAYSLLLQINSNLLDRFNANEEKFDKLKRKVKRLRKNMSAQGGVKTVRKEEVDMADSEDVMLVGELPSSCGDPVRRSSRRKKDD